jgi:hypothetical protein
MLSSATQRVPVERETWFQPVASLALYCWSAFYALFLLQAFRNSSGYLWIDNANLVVHEAGHLLFGYLGQTLGLWGGTLFQLIVPAALCATFAKQRQIFGTAFCGFVFFENLLNIATYMADARAQVLTLVTVGADSSEAEHDWNHIFSDLGILQHDTQIAAVVHAIGWLGMIATVGWMWWIARRTSPQMNAD